MRWVRKAEGFSLIEIIVVIGVVGILAALIIASISGSAEYANKVMARQEQAELQTALGNWIAATSSAPGGLAAARAQYANAANKLSLLSNYLQEATFLRLTNSGTQVRSPALTASKARLEFSSNWTTTTAPSVAWVNSP